jgi:hypothetical protein
MIEEKYCYDILPGVYNQDGEVKTVDYCNGYTIRNLGDTIVMVSGTRVFPALIAGQPGESVSIGGNIGEIFKGRLTVRFDALPGTNRLVEITQKYYIIQ